MNCLICGSPIHVTTGRPPDACPGKCMEELNRRRQEAIYARRKTERKSGDGIKEAREWLKNYQAKVDRLMKDGKLKGLEDAPSTADERLRESVCHEQLADGIRADQRNGERDPNGNQIKDGGI